MRQLKTWGAKRALTAIGRLYGGLGPAPQLHQADGSRSDWCLLKRAAKSLLTLPHQALKVQLTPA